MPTRIRSILAIALATLFLIFTPAAAEAHRGGGCNSSAPSKLSATQQQSVNTIREVWPDHLETRALRIAWRESNLIPTAKNRRSSATGLFQMLTSLHGNRAKAQGNWPLTDGTKNARAALDLYNRAGWRPWVCR